MNANRPSAEGGVSATRSTYGDDAYRGVRGGEGRVLGARRWLKARPESHGGGVVLAGGSPEPI